MHLASGPLKQKKQIAVTVWALANQETCRQISDRFDVTISSVSRCIGSVVRALVDLCTDLIQWPRGIIVILVCCYIIIVSREITVNRSCRQIN